MTILMAAVSDNVLSRQGRERLVILQRKVECKNTEVITVALCNKKTTTGSAMSERKEIEAFFNFFATFNLARPVSTIQDLADGATLFEVLSLVYVV